MTGSLTQTINEMHPRTRPTMGNWARMAFYPTGVRDFGIAVSQDLNLTKSVVGGLLKYSGTLLDGAKCLLYGAIVGRVTYQTLISKLLEQ